MKTLKNILPSFNGKDHSDFQKLVKVIPEDYSFSNDDGSIYHPVEAKQMTLDFPEDTEKYIEEHSQSLHTVQKEIISYNESLGEIKKMQIAVSQCYFLELITKVANFKNILEVGTFTGLSTLSMALGLPKDGKIVALDKDSKTNQAAVNFFKKAE